jgi:hypothetical protein
VDETIGRIIFGSFFLTIGIVCFVWGERRLPIRNKIIDRVLTRLLTMRGTEEMNPAQRRGVVGGLFILLGIFFFVVRF